MSLPDGLTLLATICNTVPDAIPSVAGKRRSAVSRRLVTPGRQHDARPLGVLRPGGQAFEEQANRPESRAERDPVQVAVNLLHRRAVDPGGQRIAGSRGKLKPAGPGVYVMSGSSRPSRFAWPAKATRRACVPSGLERPSCCRIPGRDGTGSVLAGLHRAAGRPGTAVPLWLGWPPDAPLPRARQPRLDAFPG